MSLDLQIFKLLQTDRLCSNLTIFRNFLKFSGWRISSHHSFTETFYGNVGRIALICLGYFTLRYAGITNALVSVGKHTGNDECFYWEYFNRTGTNPGHEYRAGTPGKNIKHFLAEVFFQRVWWDSRLDEVNYGMLPPVSHPLARSTPLVCVRHLILAFASAKQ